MDFFLCFVVLFCFCALTGAQSSPQITTPRQPLQISVYTLSGGSTAEVMEYAELGTVLALIEVDDPGDRVQCTTFSPENQIAALQKLFPGEYKLMLTTLLDREMYPTATIQIICRDDVAVPSLSSTVSVTVHVLDVNDNSPVFQRSVYNVSVRASAPVGTVVGNVQAVDRDTGANARLFYSLRSPRGEDDGDLALDVDATTGQLTTRRDLAMEAAGHQETFIVKAEDYGGPPLTGTATVIMTVVSDGV